MTTTPATEPTPSGDPAAQAGNTPRNPLPPLTTTQKWIVGGVAAGAAVIAGIGFVGSYNAVSKLAADKGMGDFAKAFPIGVDFGIGVFLALDLLLTWLRMPFAPLRYGAWLLTIATIGFNASTSWPDPIGVGLHSVTPLLFVFAVEGARHAIGRGADIVADKHMEHPPFSRWFTHPIDQAIIVRRQRGWNVRDYRTVIQHRKEVRIYKARLRKDHGKRMWRRNAPAEKLLVLELAHYGMTIAEAIDMPEAEARKAAEAKHRAELAEAEAEAKRRAEVAEAEATEAEAKHRTETAKAEAEAKQRIEAARAAEVEAEVKRKSEAEAARLRREEAEAEAEAKLRLEAAQSEEARKARLAEAETEAKLSALALQQRRAADEAEAQRLDRQRIEEQRLAEEKRRADAVRAEEDRRRREQRKAEETRAEVNRLREQAAARNGGSPTTSGSTSGSTPKATSVAAAGTNPKTTVSVSVSEAANLGGRRSKRQSEVDEVLARIVHAGDPKSVSLEWVMEHFGLKQTTAYDRLVTAQTLWAEANAA